MGKASPLSDSVIIRMLRKGRTIRKVMGGGGGGGFSKRQYIFFCTPIEEIYFFLT